MHSFIAYQPRTETVRSGAIKVSRRAFCLLNQSCFDQLSGDNIQKRLRNGLFASLQIHPSLLAPPRRLGKRGEELPETNLLNKL